MRCWAHLRPAFLSLESTPITPVHPAGLFLSPENIYEYQWDSIFHPENVPGLAARHKILKPVRFP
jgi:hypothetical protein